MKKAIDILKAVCGVASAVLIYITVCEAASGGKNLIVLCVASVFALSTTVLCFSVSSLEARVKNLEDTLGIYVDKGYENEEKEKKICKKCSSEIDADFVICPYCGERDDMLGADGNPYVQHVKNEKFETEDPNYKGTDHSDEEPVSANFDFFDNE